MRLLTKIKELHNTNLTTMWVGIKGSVRYQTCFEVGSCIENWWALGLIYLVGYSTNWISFICEPTIENWFPLIPS